MDPGALPQMVSIEKKYVLTMRKAILSCMVAVQDSVMLGRMMPVVEAELHKEDDCPRLSRVFASLVY